MEAFELSNGRSVLQEISLKRRLGGFPKTDGYMSVSLHLSSLTQIVSSSSLAGTSLTLAGWRHQARDRRNVKKSQRTKRLESPFLKALFNIHNPLSHFASLFSRTRGKSRKLDLIFEVLHSLFSLSSFISLNTKKVVKVPKDVVNVQ